MKSAKIELTVTQDQLDVILSTIETSFESDGAMVVPGFDPQNALKGKRRGVGLVEIVESFPPNGNSYDHDQLAGLYRQLLKGWSGGSVKPGLFASEKFSFDYAKRRLSRKPQASLRPAAAKGKDSHA